jgi:hypothetical protein
MKTGILSLALAAALSLGSTLASADRGGRDNDRRGDDRHEYSDDNYRGHYRGDHRVDGPRRWSNHRGFRHDNFNHNFRPHIHDRRCGHYAPPVIHGPRFLGPRLSGHPYSHHHDLAGGITLILRSPLN